MFEYALKGRPRYWIWLGFLATLILIAFYFWNSVQQVGAGRFLGFHRDVIWGLFLGQLAFFVGAAAGAVMIVLPYYFHNYKEFSKIATLAEFYAAGMVVIAILSVFVYLGQPARAFFVLIYPSASSIILYDYIILTIYLILNLICGWATLHTTYKEVGYPSWLKPIIYLTVLWGPSIHIVTAFLFQGLPGREYWMTAIMAPKFLASAFSAGPAMLLVLALLARKLTGFDVGRKAIDTIAKIITYSFIVNLLLFTFEIFTAFYSGIHHHQAPFLYLFFGYQGHSEYVPLMWLFVILALLALILLVIPQLRRNETTLVLGCLAVVGSVWIDKGLGLMVGGSTPNTFHTITPYIPTFHELIIEVGVWAVGFAVVTVLWKIAISVYQSKEKGVFLKSS